MSDLGSFLDHHNFEKSPLVILNLSMYFLGAVMITFDEIMFFYQKGVLVAAGVEQRFKLDIVLH